MTPEFRPKDPGRSGSLIRTGHAAIQNALWVMTERIGH
jgi:hypothetical protein